jgi:lipopolysaccharide transport system permease protein
VFFSHLAESWRYRELIYFFAWRDVKVRYKQAALGAAWAILQPLASMIVFAVIFGRLANVPSDGLPYPLFAYCGLLARTYFSGVITQAGQCLIGNANLITKVYFPRIALPFSSVAGGLLDAAISFCFLVVMMVYYAVTPSWTMLLAPLFVVLLVLLATGVGLLLAALNVSYRDVKYALPLMIQLWLFVTPILFPVSFVPENLRPLLMFNPLTGIIDGFRRTLLLGQLPDPLLTASSLAGTLVIGMIGLVYFRKAERSFADIV